MAETIENILAFHTDSGSYPMDAALLDQCLAALGHQRRMIHRVPDSGSWIDNLMHKPRLLLQEARKLDGKWALYLDVDILVLKPLSVPEQVAGSDIATVMIPHDEMLAGAILFRRNQRTVDAFEQWLGIMEAQPKSTDQPILQRVIEQRDQQGLLEWGRLPSSWLWIPAICTARGMDYPEGGPAIVATRAAFRICISEQRRLANARTA